MTVVLNFTSSPAGVPGVIPGHIAVSTGMDRVGEAVAECLLLGPDEGVLVEDGSL